MLNILPTVSSHRHTTSVTTECTLTLEEDDGVFVTLRLGTHQGSIQVVRDAREDFGDILGVAVFQFVFVVAEDFVVLN